MTGIEMATAGQVRHYCERCGTELLPADPAPLCATCWLAEGAVMVVPMIDSINGVRVRGVTDGSGPRHYAARHTPLHNEVRPAAHPRRRLAVASVLCLLSLVVMTASAPSTFASSAPSEPLYTGTVTLNKSADACLANLWKLIADKSEGRPSASDVVCPASGKPYVYTQYQGVTTISCPDPARHGAVSISVRSDTKVPVAR
ncbi:MAG TPA: hypothetical protein VIL06_00790 [Coriobacteriia bacterium]